MKTKAMKIMFVAILMVTALGLIPTASADSVDVTVTWIIPGDDTITCSFPTTKGKIEFDATAVGQNFTNLPATSQAVGTAALRVTNQGNQALNVTASFTETLPTGVVNVHWSWAQAANDTAGTWTNATALVNQTLDPSVEDGTSRDFWFWSNGTNVPVTAGISRTLRVYSAGA